jgi:drug/metabolite transporter (DMT)-like permease
MRIAKNYGLYYTLISVICASIMVIIVKVLSETTNIYSILFYRGFFGFILVTFLLIKIKTNQLYTKKIHVHFLRGAINAAALFFWFNALVLSPLAEVSAIGNSAPIFATLLAILLLKEKIFFKRILAIILGFIGVLLIVKPGNLQIEIGYYYALIAAVLWGFLVIFLKNLSKTENFFSVIFYFQLFLFVFFGIFFYQEIEVINQNNFFWLLAMALFGNLSQLFYFQALKYKDVTYVTPFEYLRFVIITILAIIFFNENPTLSTYLGSLVIFVGILIISLDRNIISKSFNFIFKN